MALQRETVSSLDQGDMGGPGGGAWPCKERQFLVVDQGDRGGPGGEAAGGGRYAGDEGGDVA